LLIQHSKYSAMLSNIFGDFAHWDIVYCEISLSFRNFFPL